MLILSALVSFGKGTRRHSFHYVIGCIIRCWSYRHAVQFLHCPCCRQEVSFLHEAFSRDLSTIPEASRTRAADLAVQVGEYNRRFSGQPRSVCILVHLSLGASKLP